MDPARRRRAVAIGALVLGIAALGFGAAALLGPLGGEDPADWIRDVAEVPLPGRRAAAEAAATRRDGTLGDDVARAWRAEPRVAEEPLLSAAVAVLDAYRPSRPDAALVAVADFRALRLPVRLRAAALRALARAVPPEASRLVAVAPTHVDLADDGFASAWADLAEALGPAVVPTETVRVARERLESHVGARARDGDAAGVARARAAADRIAAIPASAETLPPPARRFATPSEAWTAYDAVRTRRVESPEEAARELEKATAKVRALRPSWSAATPEDRLALARFADAFGERPETLRLVASLADGADEPARTAATWLVTLRLEQGDPAGALEAVARGRSAGGGRGRGRGGRGARAGGRAAAGAAAATAAARRAVEGAAADPARATRFLATARAAVSRLEPDAAERAALASAEAWVSLTGAPLDLAGVADLAPAAAAGAGPRAVVFADDFELGEDVLPSVLRRWAKHLPVHVVGRLTGRVRQGMRRARASEAEERDSIAKRVAVRGAGSDAGDALPRLAGFVPAGGEVEARLGLPATGAAVFLLDASGRVEARLSGSALDPRPLDPVVARLAPGAPPPPPVDRGPR